MAPGLPAAWPSRCAVCLLAAVGAALGPSAGSAHGSSAPDGPPSMTATAPGASSPAATASAAPSSPASPPPVLSGSTSPSAFPSALPLPSGVPVPGASGTGPVPSSPAATGRDAQAPAGPGAEEPEPSSSASASPDVSGSTAPLAGREAGAGKERPGRSLSPLEQARAEDPVEEDEPEEAEEPVVDAVDLPVSPPPSSAFTDPGQRSVQALDAADVRRVQQVSLGSGIALVGLGLGFLAFRMRRTN
ncbi:hypothetical protein ACFVFD_03455 [Streptomyces fimicarius]|uniref:hypothetical protein n=1 Tax=Streptomyces TaxID=1883 RepID=UPI0010C03EB5|nr:hypothetical protein [Streptomyces sp. BPSDS2]